MLLYTIGDSFTYGEELPTPSTQSWPALLSNKLNYDLINCGKPGTGNNYIIKTAIKQIPKLKPDLVIVAWTSCGRMEFADQHGVYDISSGWNRRFKKSYPYREILMKYITSYNNELHQYRSWLRSVILLQDFLKLRNINYRFVNTFDNHELNKKYAKISKEYIELIDTEKFLGWPNTSMMEWMADCPKGPGGHPLELGHARIADAIFSAL
jgi:lysophospholipase L1-like esterase